MREEIVKYLSEDEKIKYEGKPNRKSYIFSTIFDIPTMFMFVLDVGSIYLAIFAYADTGVLFGVIILILLIVLPLWGLTFALFLDVTIGYKNLYYLITDKAIYASRGIFTKKILTKQFTDFFDVNVHRDIFDRAFDTGDIIIKSSNSLSSSNGIDVLTGILNIKDYEKVYALIKDLQKTNYADLMYPNKRR